MNVSVKPAKLIKGSTGDWEVVIGLEIHAQVTSKSGTFETEWARITSGLFREDV
jgi:hypothetical protein